MEMTISVRSPQDVYEAFVAEFDNAQNGKPDKDVFNSDILKQWVTDAVHEIYCLGVSDGADYLDADAIKGYAIHAGICAGLDDRRINELANSLERSMQMMTVPEARAQYQNGEW